MDIESRLVSYEDVAVLVPCYNEAISIESVVRDFRAALPGASIYIYDNNSSDATKEIARKAGAIVRSELRQGKGQVVRRMFSDVDAKVYMLVDGDATYDAKSAPELVKMLVDNNLDCVNGVRVETETENYRPGHRLGNLVLTELVAMIFGRRTRDMLTGYRALSRRFVKSFPALSAGFEIETEMIVHALELRMPMADIDTPYKSRPPGSVSKLSTFKDGWRILKTIIILIKEEKPLQFFGILSALLALLAVVIFIPVLLEYFDTGAVRRFPTAVLSTGLILTSALSLVCGLILETVTRGRKEMKRMFYLACPSPHVDMKQKSRRVVVE